MAELQALNKIDPDTTADAVEVDQNYNVIRQFINTDVINRDGSNAMVAPLTLAGDPTQALHAATKQYVDALLPVGVIIPFSGTVAPAGDWRLCTGGGMTVASWPKLYAVIGYRYGGSGGTFNLPNLAGRIPIGEDNNQTRFNTTGKRGGSWLVPIPSHTHEINHNHIQATTSGQSVNHHHTILHTHEHPHTHPITHNHPQGTTSTADHHSHGGYFTSQATPAAGGNWFMRRGADGPTSATAVHADGAHNHTIDLPSFTGTSGAASDATTGAASTGNSGDSTTVHTHTVDFAQTTGLVSAATKLERDLDLGTGITDNTGTDMTSTELVPPFVVIQYIIRVD